VFNVQGRELLGSIDEAWSLRGLPVPDDPMAFVVPTGRVVGRLGETAVRIVVRGSELISEYPVFP
jgi:hypothetical protein